MSKSKDVSVKKNSPRWWFEDDVDTSVRQGLKLTPLYSTKSPYQEIGVFEHEHLGRVLTLDRIVQTTQGDEFIYHEMITHVPLLGKKWAGKISVLIIGGGDGGTLREVLRHENVERVVMVEIDGDVVEVSKKYIKINGNYEDPRVELRIGDGAAYVQSKAAQEKPFDLVIIDSGDPVGPGEVLFTEQFCLDVFNVLTETGVMARHLGIPAYQKPIFERGVVHMKQVFPLVEIYRAAIPTYTGGDMAFVLGLKDSQSCQNPKSEIIGRYYNSLVHSAAFALPTWWKESIKDTNGVKWK